MDSLEQHELQLLPFPQVGMVLLSLLYLPAQGQPAGPEVISKICILAVHLAAISQWVQKQWCRIWTANHKYEHKHRHRSEHDQNDTDNNCTSPSNSSESRPLKKKTV